MRQHLRPANLVTSGSLTLGFLALVLAPRHLALATVLVLAAAALDGIDGALARRAGGDHTFGAQLDSLADLLCFCVVPAFALHSAVSAAGAPISGVVAGCLVVVAGAWRLSRFPLVQAEGHFVGLPTPAAGGLLMLLALWTPPLFAVLGAVALSALMVSSLRVPTVLAAAGSVRPGRRAHALRRRLGHRPVLVQRALRHPRAHRRRGTGAGQQASGRALVLATLRRRGVRRRRDRP